MEEETYSPELTMASLLSMILSAFILWYLWASGYKFEDATFTIIVAGTFFFFGLQLALLEIYIYYKNKHIAGDNKE